MKNDRVYIEQILDAIHKILEFTQGMDHETFSTDQKTQSAVIMQLALIGELAKRVSDEMKSQIDVPWKEITAFRNRAIHEYYQIDIDIVWKTVIDDLLELEKGIHGGVA